MAENEGGGNSSPYAGLVEKIAANLNADWQEVQHRRANEAQQWRDYANMLKGQDALADGQQRGAETRDGNYAAAGEHWRGAKAASNTQKAENATWSATRKDDREAAKDVQSASRGRVR